ncbi:MAG: glycoside hydrolase family 88 protein [Acidimicrobiales bacterium]
MNHDHRELLHRVAVTLERLPYTTWNFGDSVAFEGLIAAGGVLGTDRPLAFARGMVRGWATRRHPFVPLDCVAPGLAMVEIYRRTADSLVLEAAVELAAYLRGRPTLGGVYATWEHSPLKHPWGPDELPACGVALLTSPPPGVFVDCLHFDPPFFAALGRTIGDAALVNDGVEQARGYIRLLQRNDGLFEHFVLDESPTTYGPGWGRGQGWALLGLLHVVAELDPTDDRRAELVASAVRLVAAMRATQRDDGNWDAVVGDAASGDENSTAAFMADGFLWAVELGAIADVDVAAVRHDARRALDAAVERTDEHGHLTSVSAAVNACTTASHYVHVPRGFVVPWGQGPLALALARHLTATASVSA